jgi:hypothetical protein
MINSEIPLLKADLMKAFGYISYQLIFANLDAVGIWIKSSGEVVVITYRGKKKSGFIYDSGDLPEETVLEIYKDTPDDYNNLQAHEKAQDGKIEILVMPKNNYVFVSEKEVKPIKK